MRTVRESVEDGTHLSSLWLPLNHIAVGILLCEYGANEAGH